MCLSEAFSGIIVDKVLEDEALYEIDELVRLINSSLPNNLSTKSHHLYNWYKDSQSRIPWIKTDGVSKLEDLYRFISNSPKLQEIL